MSLIKLYTRSQPHDTVVIPQLKVQMEEMNWPSIRQAIDSGFSETSCVLAVREDLVDVSSAAPGYMGSFDEKFSRLLMKKGMTAFTKNGVLGDPSGSSAEAGQKIIQNLVDHIVTSLTEMKLKT